jgi:DNA-binding MarR family transcriptional regulator
MVHVSTIYFTGEPVCQPVEVTVDRRLFFVMHRAQRALLTHATARTIEALGVSPAQLATLRHVSKHPGCSLSELAKVLDVAKSAITTMTRRMEAAGLLRREPNAADGRGGLLFVTEKGENIRVQALPLMRRLNAEILEGFSEAEAETILRFFNALVTRYADRDASDEG